MGSRGKDITGQRFGRLVALEPTEKRSGDSVVWKCQCDCGNISLHSANGLKRGNIKSCGCSRKENLSLQQNLGYVEGTCIKFIENADKVSARNSSGHRGVQKFRNKWQAKITFKKKTYHLGTFEDKEDAIKARLEAEEKLYGEFLEWYYHREISK